MLHKTLSLVALLTLALSACAAGRTSAPDGHPTTLPASTSEANQASTAAPTPKVNATSPASPTSKANSSSCTDSAAFVSDVTVLDNTNLDTSEAFVKTWRVKNTGTCAWTDKYTLVFSSGEQMGAPDSVPLSATQPGKTLDISVNMTAPAKDAAYRGDYELRNPSGEAMPIDNGTSLWIIITVGTATAASGGPGSASATCAFTVSSTNVSAIIDAINAYRADNGLPALTVNPTLTAAAQAHSNDMACNSLFVHTGSDGSTPQSRATAAGYSGTVTENVYGRNPPPSGQEVVAWWATDQTDPRHGQNLLTTKYTEVGVGYSFFNDFGYYAVVFGAP
ncbi:MAG: hypothetical protein KJZ52_11605 [Anaerolineales bacterium]|nr:hypothetical protein [Anaerolineales bacterium]